jgi:activating signal cointegrator complex subunit 3
VIKCPINYGFKATDLEDDPSGHGLLLNKIQSCVENLNRMRLIRYNQNTDAVYSTDMGRVASNYYINCETMGYFMGNLLPHTRSEMILYHMA